MVRVGMVGLRPELAVPAVAAVMAAGGEPVVVDAPDGVGTSGGRTSAVGAPPGDCALLLVDPVGAGLGVPGVAAGREPPASGLGASGATLIVHQPGERTMAEAAAGALSAAGIIELPGAAAWLASHLQAHPQPASAARPAMLVLGAVGGAGASTVAIACAAARSPGCLLVDVDRDSTGLDLPLGIAAGEGARWAAIPASGRPIVADSLRAALPQVAGVHVLTGEPLEPGDARAAAVVAGGRAGFGALVADVGRGPLPAWAHPQDPAVVVLPATLAGVVGARRRLQGLGARPVVLAVRPTAWLGAADVAEELGATAVVEVEHVRRLGEASDCGDLLGGRVGRALRQLGQRCGETLP